MPEKIVTVSEPHRTKLEVKEFPPQTCVTYMTNLKLWKDLQTFKIAMREQ